MVQRISPGLRLIAACAWAAAMAAAQDPLPDPTKLVSIDRVVATVNDAVILESDLMQVARGELRTAETNKGGKLTPQERTFILQRNLQELVNQAALSQAAKTLGVLPPDRVEQLFQQMLEEDRKEQIRDSGSLMKFSESLAASGRTWQTYERDQRLSKLADLTKQIAVTGRLANQRGLFITPRMMRQWFERNQKALGESKALVAVVAFAGDQARQDAEKAATLWRNEAITPTDLAKRMTAEGAVDLGVLLIDEASRKDRPKDLVDFALAGPANQVTVVDKGSAVQVWKVTDFVGGKQQPFDDPQTQSDIRRELERRVVKFLTDQTIQRARERTEPWMPLSDMAQARN